MCPDKESNQRPLGAQADTQLTEPPAKAVFDCLTSICTATGPGGSPSFHLGLADDTVNPRAPRERRGLGRDRVSEGTRTSPAGHITPASSAVAGSHAPPRGLRGSSRWWPAFSVAGAASPCLSALNLQRFLARWAVVWVLTPAGNCLRALSGCWKSLPQNSPEDTEGDPSVWQPPSLLGCSTLASTAPQLDLQLPTCQLA